MNSPSAFLDNLPPGITQEEVAREPESVCECEMCGDLIFSGEPFWRDWKSTICDDCYRGFKEYVD